MNATQGDNRHLEEGPVNTGLTIEDLSRSTYCWELDVRGSMHRVYFRDGRCAESPITNSLSVGTSTIRRSLYFFDANKLVIEFSHGAPAIVDIYDVRQVDKPTTKPVVYLDQCHWSTIAKVHFEPNKIRSREIAAAAKKIISWALNGKVILPLSSGHLIETTAIYNSKRQNLASIMIILSRGWQMRNPILVRGEEILEVVARRYRGHEIERSPVFTLAPNVILSNELPSDPFGRAPANEVTLLKDCLTSVCSIYDMLMNPNQIPSEKATRWADTYATLSQVLKNSKLKRSQRRRAALEAAILDATNEVLWAAAAIRIRDEDLRSWIENHLEEDLLKMPFFGLYADVLDFRLSNFNSKWLPNDFIDMLFLTCAMGYADVVAAEKAATNYIKQAWGERPGEPTIVRTLPEVVLSLEERIDG